MSVREPTQNGRSRVRRRILIGAVALVVVAAAAAGVLLVARNADGKGAAAANGKKKDGNGAPAASPVEVATVEQGGIATFLQGTTTLEARNAATLVASRQGRVTALEVEEGQWVEQGEVLARLDDTEARLAVERAEVTLQMSRKEAERGRQMREQGYLSEKEMDDLELKRRSAEVELGQARYDLAETRIVAPFSGRITQRMIQLGETLTPGRECFRLEDFSPILARVYFPEREAARVRPGQPAWVELNSRPGEPIEARVSLVNPVVDRSNGTFKVTLELPNPRGELRPGAFARVRLKTGEFVGAILVPRRAVLLEDGESYVFVARGDSVVRTRIQVGASEGERSQVLAGLAAGDRIVTVGQGGLKTGSRIKVVSF
jgi:membrane fusion protein (multidrug efflux system)